MDKEWLDKFEDHVGFKLPGSDQGVAATHDS
jgi:hypothetical protein